ncbi:hypothetical protein EJB05_30008 [Eragrostis curvula]|uniref:Uncharacterized protein n=1 Tax=Eragrostis curvula TaxID=38414 RepID=A0A5J9UU51_9POAL|nr:hypothetical protein EJB05_30008 [Eragrostis curvula]
MGSNRSPGGRRVVARLHSVDSPTKPLNLSWIPVGRKRALMLQGSPSSALLLDGEQAVIQQKRKGTKKLQLENA